MPYRAGAHPIDLAVGLGAAWVTDTDGSVYRVDATDGSLTRFPIGAPVTYIAIDPGDGENGTVWLTAEHAPAPTT